MARTGFVYRKECLKHDAGQFHPESPNRLEAILQAFIDAGIDPPLVDVEPAVKADILRIHSEEHYETIKRTCENNFPYPDPDTRMVRKSWDAALLAAGGAISACKEVIDGEIDHAFWAMRPPGHHAEKSQAMGFCLFNNIAIAARWLQHEAGLKRVAILDWDIHHGNGTQHSFFEDDSVYYFSIHQHPHYPGTGYPDEKGKNNSNLNMQMPPGCAAEEWHRVMDAHVLPELERFDPDFLLVSSGFDAHRLDPLGHQLLEAEDYAGMTRKVKQVAGGRIVSLLEGGYHLEALGWSAVAHFQALCENGAA